MTASTKATETHQPHRCLKCRRILKNASPDGYGPTCRRYIKRAARSVEIARYKETQVAKAVELLEQGGLIPLRKTAKNTVFLAVSSDGSTAYKTAGTGQCNCPAGLKAKYACKHGIAAHIVTIASRTLAIAA
jgi:hypothetical protein